MRKILSLFLLLSVFYTPLHATHIVGGEITYRCLGNNQYEITLEVYRDCYNGIPWFDNPASVGIYNSNWNLVQNLTLFYNGSNDTLPIILTNPCLTAPPDVCVNRAFYTRIVTLPFAPGGYSIVYQRCCRNMLIRNIPDPLNTGISIVAEISEKALTECNNGAVFNNWPPVAICINEPIDFDHSASDSDGDSLAYRLCTPLNGPDSLNPIPSPPLPGPYQEVEWVNPPYSLNNVLGGVPLSIHPETGFMTGIPNLIGNFVVGVCVDEYRNDTLISTTRRDFQYNVADCGKPAAAFFAPEISCDTLGVRFQNQSTGALFFRWFFDIDEHPNWTSTAFSPFFTYPDTGRYLVALIADPLDPCRDTSFQEIYLTKTYVQADIDVSLPDCDDNGLVVQANDQSADPVFGVNNWQWSLTGPGTAANSSLQNPQFVVTSPGDYTLKLVASGANGCKDSTTLNFNAPIPVLDNFEEQLSICSGDSVALYPGFNSAYTYRWSPTVSLSNPTVGNPIAFPTTSTAYTVTVSTQECDRQGTVTVSVLSPGSLTVTVDPERIYKGETSQLTATFPGATSFLWEPAAGLSDPAGPNPLASPDETTTYRVTAFLSSGCTASATLTVLVLSPFCDEPYIFFPNAFSPNGDGENDVLQLEGRFIESVYWVIYNRWGQKIFEADSADDAWDGTYEGKDQPNETYGFYLRVSCPDGQVLEKKGNISLLR
jgi:gliding motility-associated-like protein